MTSVRCVSASANEIIFLSAMTMVFMSLRLVDEQRPQSCVRP